MEYLPPVGWADVATKQDVDHLAGKIDALEGRIGALETRFDALETRSDVLTERVSGLAAGVGACATNAEVQAQFNRHLTLMVMLLSVFAAFVKFA